VRHLLSRRDENPSAFGIVISASGCPWRWWHLYGSDFFISHLRLTDSQIEDIFYRNARRMLGLE